MLFAFFAITAMPLTPEQILALLAATPKNIGTLTVGLTSTQLHSSLSPDEWSANDVLAHLRSCADVWGNYIKMIITQDRPAFRAVSPRTWIKKTDYRSQAFQPSLQAFITQRLELLASLESLPFAGWSRAAMVTMVGRVLERTVSDYAERMIQHEGPHIQQIEQTVNAIRKS